MNEKHVILDLDGTLLFAEERPAGLMVSGRRRNSYMARETIELLRGFQEKRRIILATGRSRSSVMVINRSLEEEGIKISGAAAENGGIWIDGRGAARFLAPDDWISRAKPIEQHMAGMIQDEFESCVALLKPDEAVLQRLDEITAEWGLEHRRLQDGNKLFILAPEVDKKHALELMLGRNALEKAWGIGNDMNDLDWMEAVEIPAAPACARNELLEAVEKRQGLISASRGHDGIKEILMTLGSMSSNCGFSA